MNEELQSTNEELETINDEMRLRSGELNRVNAFFDTILRATGLGIIVLDAQGRVRVWDATSEDLWGLRPDEVLEHEFRNLEFGLPVAKLRGAIRAALGPDGERTDLVVEARNRRGQPVVCRVTCLPLGPEESEIGGGVIILVEPVEEERAVRAAEGA
jgi:two-component system, chemotaxis family, CheB/CheR fusion protein